MKKAALKLAKGARSKGVFAPIDQALKAIRAGEMIIVVDDEDRENEGDLTMAASKVTPEAVNFMVKHGRGLLCLAMTPERLDELEIPLEVSDNSSPRETAFPPDDPPAILGSCFRPCGQCCPQPSLPHGAFGRIAKDPDFLWRVTKSI